MGKCYKTVQIVVIYNLVRTATIVVGVVVVKIAATVLIVQRATIVKIALIATTVIISLKSMINRLYLMAHNIARYKSINNALKKFIISEIVFLPIYH